MLNINRDYTSRHGAEIIARVIRAYWISRGKVPTIQVVEDGPGFYVVRSTMIGGRP